MKNYLNKFKAQSPAAILQLVFKSDKQVSIAVSLRNGSYLEGILIDFAEKEYATFICMEIEGVNVVFFEINEVVFVIVKQPKSFAVELSKGSISRALNTNESISLLQLKRNISTLETTLGLAINFQIEEDLLKDQNFRLNSNDFVNCLQKVVQEIKSDAMGIEAWNTLNEVQITQNELFKTSKKHKKLSIQLNLSKALPTNLHLTLKDQIEAVL